ncbi:hypothetical protein [Algihabitans albus]|uniref:hypothetical protein n=1 Tax=Algihabitans albus TaxID=2164067 RepID=UPI000E5D0947|nr:hypothetical protein [Algihabitans albus]
MAQTSIGLMAYAPALPRLRLSATAYREAWGGCQARGLKRKAFCAYDEDAVTLAIAAARAVLDRVPDSDRFDAIFLGATSLPYEEKPSGATILSALTERRDLRVVEIGGSTQAGLQALIAAWEFCAAAPGRRALAIAADAPAAPVDAPYEHALGAGAAAFLVGADGAVATFERSGAVSRETFGRRMRRQGAATLQDLELRTDDVGPVLRDLRASFGAPTAVDFLALGGDAAAARRAPQALGVGDAALCAPWSELGDGGAALAGLALCDALDRAKAGEAILAVALGGGATVLSLKAAEGAAAGLTLTESAAGGREVGYLDYLRHKRMLSSRFGGTA